MMNYYNDKYDIIIIGASLACLSAALQLGGKKDSILVLEQQLTPGGVATSYVRGGTEFEASLHEMMSVGTKENPLAVRSFLDSHKVDVDWLRLDECYRFIAPGIDVKVHSGDNGNFKTPAKDIASISQEKDAYDKVLYFLELCDKVSKSFFDLSLKKVDLEERKTLYPEYDKYINSSLEDVFDELKLEPAIRDVLSAYWSYWGSPINDTPFVVSSIILAGYFGYGAYIPKNTSFEIGIKMVKACMEKGIQIEFGQKVQNILVEDEKVKGVRLANGTVINCDYIISGAYPNTLYNMIEGFKIPNKLDEQLSNKDIGVTCFSVNMLLDKDYHDLNIKDYSTFYCLEKLDTIKEYNGSFDYHNWKYITSVCLNVANEDASMKGTTLYSITYLPKIVFVNNFTVDNYYQLKDEITSYLIEIESKRLGINLKEHIIELAVETPITISRYTSSYKGSIYGYRHQMKDSITSRIERQIDENFISGLFFANATSVFGDGMAPAFSNGKVAAMNLVMEKIRRRRLSR